MHVRVLTRTHACTQKKIVWFSLLPSYNKTGSNKRSSYELVKKNMAAYSANVARRRKFDLTYSKDRRTDGPIDTQLRRVASSWMKLGFKKMSVNVFIISCTCRRQIEAADCRVPNRSISYREAGTKIKMFISHDSFTTEMDLAQIHEWPKAFEICLFKFSINLKSSSPLFTILESLQERPK